MKDLESRFYRHMGFDGADLTHHYGPYLAHFADAQSVLDLACGDGQFLRMLQDRGKTALGVDGDPGMVRAAAGRGCRVIEQDVFRFLEDCVDRFDGVFCAHLVEHLEPPRVAELLSMVFRVLQPDGVLVLVAPNPKSAHTMLQEFWRDPTHLRPYPDEVLAFFAEAAGFTCLSNGTNPVTQPFPEIRIKPARRKSRLVRALRRMLRPLLDAVADLSALEATQRLIAERINKLLPPTELFIVGRKPSADQA